MDHIWSSAAGVPHWSALQNWAGELLVVSGGSKAFPTPGCCLPLEPLLSCCPAPPGPGVSPALPAEVLSHGRCSRLKQSTAQGPSLCPDCSSLDTGLLLAELITPLRPPLKDPDSQGKRKMLFKTSLLCRAHLCAARQQCCAPSRAAMSMALTCVCTETYADTRTLLRSSSTSQIAPCNLSHTIDTAVAAHTPLGSSAASEPCVTSVRSA